MPSLFPEFVMTIPDDQGYGFRPAKKEPAKVSTVPDDKEIKDYHTRLLSLARENNFQAFIGNPKGLMLDHLGYLFAGGGTLTRRYNRTCAIHDPAYDNIRHGISVTGNRYNIDYHENVYFVRPITEYDDLLDEAAQQHNCVASYADRIAKRQSRIFTMRETAHPEKSLMTIELSPDCRTVRQKYLAYNHPVHNRSMTEFIDRWMKQLNS